MFRLTQYLLRTQIFPQPTDYYLILFFLYILSCIRMFRIGRMTLKAYAN